MTQGERTDLPLPDPDLPIPTGGTIGQAIERIAPGNREAGDELEQPDIRLLLRVAGAKPLYNCGRVNGHRIA